MKPPHVISAPKNYNFNIQGMAEIIPQTSYVCLPFKKNKQTERKRIKNKTFDTSHTGLKVK